MFLYSFTRVPITKKYEKNKANIFFSDTATKKLSSIFFYVQIKTAKFKSFSRLDFYGTWWFNNNEKFNIISVCMRVMSCLLINLRKKNLLWVGFMALVGTRSQVNRGNQVIWKRNSILLTKQNIIKYIIKIVGL